MTLPNARESLREFIERDLKAAYEHLWYEQVIKPRIIGDGSGVPAGILTESEPEWI